MSDVVNEQIYSLLKDLLDLRSNVQGTVYGGYDSEALFSLISISTPKEELDYVTLQLKTH